ncbi:MAG: 50S ribosomal protein L9 [Candidatus Kaiserbacteria bacterium]|nr:50S ribosomal protein L9 [Candidatus Kaiserbacteria bacterium]MCB9816080.1 50S ribosomal protein L9 [Candidatus Nomurabacteria bacterium]
MKVILLQDVAKIGRRSQIVEVPDGYALNQLIPKRMAEPATTANLKRIERQQAQVAQGVAAGSERFAKALEALSATTLQVAADANEQDHLFQAVHEKEIVAAAEAAGVSIDAAMITISTPIKELGQHTVGLATGAEKGTFTIEVIKK